MTTRLDDLAQPGIDALDPVGGVDHPPDRRRKCKERDHPVPRPPPGRDDGGEFLPPLPCLEGVERRQSRLGAGRGIDRTQRRGQRLAVLPTGKVEAVADQVHNAGLQRGRGEHRAQRLRHPFQAVGHRNQNVVDAADLEVIEHLHPELGPFGSLDPNPRNVARAVPLHAERQIHRLVAHHPVFADLHPQRVEEHHRIDRLQRPALPRRHLRQHPVGHRADQVGADLGGIGFNQIALDLPHRQAARIQRHDLVVEAGKAPRVLGNQQRLEAAVAVARRLDPHLAVTGQHRLAGAAVAVVGGVVGSVRPGLVAEVMVQLRVQSRLDQRLLEGDASRLDRFAVQRAGQEMGHQLLRDRRQLGDVTRYPLRFAQHNTLLRVRYASHTKLRTGSETGVYCLRTTLTEPDDATLWRIYAMLTNLEAVFRSLKTDLGLRPVYHQTERRVEGHLFISVLAYYVVHTVRLQLKAKGINEAWETTRNTLSNQVRITTTLQRRDGRTVHVRKASRPEPPQQQIYAALKLSANPGGSQQTIL